MTNRSKSFVVYDERGILEPDEAQVLVACSSLKEAWSYVRGTFGSGAIYEYDVTPRGELVNESLVGWRSDGHEWPGCQSHQKPTAKSPREAR